MKVDEIIHDSLLIRDFLHTFENFAENPIDIHLQPIPPFQISDDIKLLIIGQDPTIRNERQREKIKVTLNLDKKGAIKTYIELICQMLGMGIENVYATNIFKYFYTKPPADTIEILVKHLRPSLTLLKKEIALYPNIPVITLGEPVLRLLMNRNTRTRMTYYWDYNEKTRKTNGNFKYSSEKENSLGRMVFPMPHQPSIGKEFYSSTLEKYVSYIKTIIASCPHK